MKVISAFRIYTFMDNKVLSVLFRNQCVGAVRAAEFQLCVAVFFRGEAVLTDLAQDLPFGTVVLIKIRFRNIATGHLQSSLISHSERRLTGLIGLKESL